MKQPHVLLITLLLSACSSQNSNLEGPDKKTIGTLPTEKQPNLEVVTEFKGVRVTGVTVSKDGRIFANFPRWREKLPFSVVEVMKDGSHKPYPDVQWNQWNGKPEKNKFTCVQSVVAHNNSLYVLDPSSPMLKGVIGRPKLYEFDLATNTLKNSWEFNEKVASKKSYLNDLRVDVKNGKIYITDSGQGGIVVLNLNDGKAHRILDNHASTKAEDIVLTVEKKKFMMNGKPAKIHSDGIALSPVDNKLYYHALTGYHLYSISTQSISEAFDKNKKEIEKNVSHLGVTPAPDGMIFDQKGNLFMGDLERNAVAYRKPNGEIKILIQDERIKWPDTFSLDSQNRLLFTDSLLHAAAPGKSVEDMTFPIYRVQLPQNVL